MIAANPMTHVEQIPNAEPQVIEEQDSADDQDPADDDIGEGLDEAELKTLIKGFEPSSLYPVVALAAATGARRSELLALRWRDLEPGKKTLRIERAWDGRRLRFQEGAQPAQLLEGVCPAR